MDRYCGLEGAAALDEPQNVCSVPRFLADLPRLSAAEQSLAMKVLLLTQALDGEMDGEELRVWQRVGIAIGRGPTMDVDALRGVAHAFRSRVPLTAAMLEEALDDDQSNNQAAQEASGSSYLMHRLQQTLLM